MQEKLGMTSPRNVLPDFGFEPRYTLRLSGFEVSQGHVPKPPRGQGQRTVNRNASSVSFGDSNRLRRGPARADGACAGELGGSSGMDQPARQSAGVHGLADRRRYFHTRGYRRAN